MFLYSFLLANQQALQGRIAITGCQHCRFDGIASKAKKKLNIRILQDLLDSLLIGQAKSLLDE
jgi:DNA polymerase III psi subunit